MPKATDPITVIAGSGVSLWHPTAVPTGQAFTSSVFRALFVDEHGSLAWGLRDDPRPLLAGLPFEVVLEKCPNEVALLGLLVDVYGGRGANPLHEAIAQALCTGRATAVITTNYDCGFEQALRGLPGRAVRVIRSSDVAGTVGWPILFKIHGTIDDGTGDTLVFRLGHEGVLRRWKRNLLRELVHNRTVLIMGYSGLDFDICPELAESRPAYVIWNFLNPGGVTQNAEKVLREVPGEVVVGDMCEVVARMWGPVAARRPSGTLDLEGLIRGRFAARDRCLWGLGLLNIAGDSADGLACVESLRAGPANGLRSQEERARVYFHRGQYRLSARAFEAAARRATSVGTTGTPPVRLWLSASDAWRCYGGNLRAILCLRRARVLASAGGLGRPGLLGLVAAQALRQQRDLFAVPRVFRIRPADSTIRRLAAAAWRALAATGQWDEVQHLRLWLERLGWSFDKVVGASAYAPPPSREGYMRMGEHISRMLAFRDSVEPKARLDPAELDELAESLSLAERLGSRPEAWKLRYIRLRKSPGRPALRTLNPCIRDFLRCQYTILKRLGLLFVPR